VTILEQYLKQDRLRLIDVGARGGVDARWARFESVLEVTAFEPDRAECERLNQGAINRKFGSYPGLIAILLRMAEPKSSSLRNRRSQVRILSGALAFKWTEIA